MTIPNQLIIKTLGLEPYESVWAQMKAFTLARDASTPDEIWFCEHPPVFTLGCRTTNEHIIQSTHSIPIIQTDRGGLITYHGPGQIMMYVLLDLRRHQLAIRSFVQLLQKVVISTLAELQIQAYADDSRPGVFVRMKNDAEAKICSIGLRVSKGKSYHGLSLNYDMDLSPFQYINPCGFHGLKMTDVKTLNPRTEIGKKQTIELLATKMNSEIRE